MNCGFSSGVQLSKDTCFPCFSMVPFAPLLYGLPLLHLWSLPPVRLRQARPCPSSQLCCFSCVCGCYFSLLVLQPLPSRHLCCCCCCCCCCCAAALASAAASSANVFIYLSNICCIRPTEAVCGRILYQNRSLCDHQLRPSLLAKGAKIQTGSADGVFVGQILNNRDVLRGRDISNNVLTE